MDMPMHYRDGKGRTVLAVMWSTTSLASLFVFARLYTKMRILKETNIDDAIIACSMLIGFLFVGLTTASVEADNGRHAQSPPQYQYERAKMLNTAAFAPGILSFVIPKLSVTALLMRILNPSRRTRRFLWSFVGTSCLFISGCIVVIFAQCRPPQGLWAPRLEGIRCWSPRILVRYSICAGALSAFVDLFLAAYPSVVLWRLQMELKRKMTVIVIFCLGSCACIISIIKCTHIPSLANRSDSTDNTADLVLWTNVESNTIIIAACIPTLAPLMDHLRKRVRSQGKYSNENRTHYFEPRSNDRGPVEDAQALFHYVASCQAVNPGHRHSLLDSRNGIQRRDEVILEFERSLA